MAQNGHTTSNWNGQHELRKESCYTFVSDIYDKNWIKIACYCYNTNYLHEQNIIYTQLLTCAGVDQLDGYSMLLFNQPCHFVSSYHVKMWQHAVYLAPFHDFLVQYGHFVRACLIGPYTHRC